VDATADSSGADAAMCPDNTPFVPVTWAPPTSVHEGVCTAAQIGTFVTAATMASAQLPSSGSGMCVACILTPESAAAHGPIVEVE